MCVKNIKSIQSFSLIFNFQFSKYIQFLYRTGSNYGLDLTNDLYFLHPDLTVGNQAPSIIVPPMFEKRKT